MSICVICCNGTAPFNVLTEISKQNKDVKCILIEDIFDDNRLLDFDYKIINIAKIGAILDHLKNNKLTELVIIGGLKMPKFSELKPDLRGSILISKILMLKNKGDDNILKLIESEISKNNIKILPASDFLPKKQIKTIAKPTAIELNSIKIGVDFLDKNSHFDIGQSIVVSDGRIVGIEASEGTDELIKRCGQYFLDRKVSEKMILIKKSKINQSKNLDTPTIGIETFENMHKNNFCGIAINQEKTIILDSEKIVKFADENDIFIYITT